MPSIVEQNWKKKNKKKQKQTELDRSTKNTFGWVLLDNIKHSSEHKVLAWIVKPIETF